MSETTNEVLNRHLVAVRKWRDDLEVKNRRLQADLAQRTAECDALAAEVVEDAKRAGLSGDNWRKYTRAMLFARCISAGYKTHCPDALGAAPVYVEAHGETEIPDDPKPEPKAKAVSPAAMRSMSPAERSAETKRLLAPTRAEFDGQAAPTAPAPTDDTFVIPATARIAAIKTPKGEVWRVDIEGREQPIAVRDPSIASGIEANLAFSEPTYCRLEHDGKRDIVVEIVKAPKEAKP
jgi:hypothetical protein